MRVRQVVLAAHDLDATVERLRSALPLGEPYHDPGVAEFGLRNAVMGLGDAFVEVVSPVRPDTAAGRHLDRRGGDSGYMVLVQVDDLAAARERAADLGIRTVWTADEPAISASHLHPSDTGGGTLLSLDEPRPPASWQWGGSAFDPAAAPATVSVTLAVPDPGGVAARWSTLLDRAARDDAIELDGGAIRFVAGDAGLCRVEVAMNGATPVRATIGGVDFAVP